MQRPNGYGSQYQHSSTVGLSARFFCSKPAVSNRPTQRLVLRPATVTTKNFYPAENSFFGQLLKLGGKLSKINLGKCTCGFNKEKIDFIEASTKAKTKVSNNVLVLVYKICNNSKILKQNYFWQKKQQNLTIIRADLQ